MTATYQVKRTRTGTHLHLAYPGSNQAFCGVRKLAQVTGRFPAARCCDKCFGSNPTNFNGKCEAVEITNVAA